jgi:hypothetical protein
MKMITKLTMLTAAATIEIGLIAVPSNASVRVLHNPHARRHITRSYRAPEGQADNANPDRAQYEQPWSCGGGSCYRNGSQKSQYYEHNGNTNRDFHWAVRGGKHSIERTRRQGLSVRNEIAWGENTWHMPAAHPLDL